MKKVILSAAVIVLGFIATSCKKYNCTCYDASGNATISTVSATNAAGASTKCIANGSDCTL